MSGGKDVATSDEVDPKVAKAGTEKIDPAKLGDIRAEAHGPGVAVAEKDGRPAGNGESFLKGMQLVDAEGKDLLPAIASKPLAPKLEAAVDQIEAAANGGLTGIGTDTESLWKAIAPLSAKEFEMVNARFEKKYGPSYSWFGEKWDLRRELIDELGEGDLTRFNKMIADKRINDVPEQFRTTGESLLKPNSDLKVGEMNRIKLADGRDYDVYIPRNADSRAPVMVAMSGAGGGDMKGVMATESGLTIEAEKQGAIIVFANAKERTFGEGWMSGNGVAWNTPGRLNMPKQVDNSYDDRVYLDNVLDDLAKRTSMAQKVGLMGFSDGGRFAAVYAADRPERVAGVVSLSGTWMDGANGNPEKPMPFMAVHGTNDGMLPYNGGFGDTSEEFPLPTNLDKQDPRLLPRIFGKGAGGSGEIRERVRRGDVEERTYDAGNTEVKEYIISGAEHGIHDYKNNGARWIQYFLGRPDLRQDFVTQGAGFLKKHIVRDITT